MGNAYGALGQIGQAIEYKEQALTIAREIRDRYREGVCLSGLGDDYRALGQIGRAIEYEEQALAIAREVGSRRREGIRLSQLGNAYRALGQIGQAIEYKEQALTIAREVGYRPGEGICLSDLGDAYYALGQTERAASCYAEALAITRGISSRRRESRNLLGLGRVMLTTRELSQSRQYCQDSRSLNVPTICYQAALMLGIVLLHQHDPATGETFADAISRCQGLLDKTPGLYEPRYALAAALVGQAVCDPRWADESQRASLLAPALEEYRRALVITSAPGIVGDAQRDLELIRAAGVEGLEPVFELLESAKGASNAATISSSD